MDPVTLAYYAIVCGILGATAPRIPGLVARFAIGIMVGLIAAGALPWIKTTFGLAQ